jgi:hypothetical protein
MEGLLAGTALIAVGLPVRQARAARTRAEPHAIGVHGHALGALVAVIGGDLVTLTDAGDGLAIVIDGASKPVIATTKLKGAGADRARFLDDARFAPGVGAKIRDLLSAAFPESAATFAANHKGWSRGFALDVVKWTKQLKTSKVAGKTVNDAYGRTYLLSWAGARVDPASPTAAPAALAKVPAEPNAPTLAAYKAYIGRLVAAVA